MDSDGKDHEIIAKGTGIVLATLKVQTTVLSTEYTVGFSFKDGIYSTVDLGVKLNNMIVIGGQSITRAKGLTLTDQAYEFPVPPRI